MTESAHETEYLRFEEVPHEGKTQVWKVVSVRHGDELGRVRWHGAWRQYVFAPSAHTLWNPTCLANVIDFLYARTDEWRQAQRAKGGSGE